MLKLKGLLEFGLPQLTSPPDYSHTRDLFFLYGEWDPRTNPDRKRWQPDLAAVGAAIQPVSDTGGFKEEAPEAARWRSVSESRR